MQISQEVTERWQLHHRVLYGCQIMRCHLAKVERTPCFLQNHRSWNLVAVRTISSYKYVWACNMQYNEERSSGRKHSQKEQHINKKNLHEKLWRCQGSGGRKQAHDFLYIKAEPTDRPTWANGSLHFHSSPGLTHQTSTEYIAVKTTGWGQPEDYK